MSEIEDSLIRAKNLIDISLNDLRTAPEKADISELLDQIQKLDDHYKRWCDEYDKLQGEEIGTTYKHGVCLEYYIEAEWWHDISLAFRKIKHD